MDINATHTHHTYSCHSHLQKKTTQNANPLTAIFAKRFWKPFENRKKADFLINGYYDYLITTDDLGGVKEQIVEGLVKDIVDDSIKARTFFQTSL